MALSDSKAMDISLTLPEVDDNETVTIALTVSNEGVNSLPANVTINITNKVESKSSGGTIAFYSLFLLVIFRWHRKD